MRSTGAKLISYAVVSLWAVAGVSIADDRDPGSDAEGCRPDVQVTTINGLDPATFAAPDGSTDQDVGDVSVAVSHVGADCGQALNSPPHLHSPWVSPVWGPPTEWVTYQVRYVDADGDVPTYIRVIIDNATTIDLSPAPGSVLDYAAGVDFQGSPQSPLRMGMHTYHFQAADSFDEATTGLGYGPRIIDFVTGAVDQANPANRMVIHPIANGPTLVPASEVPPTLLPLVGNPLQGILSYTFDVDPEAGNGRAEAVVSSWGGENLLRDGGFEDGREDEYGNRLIGSAVNTATARTGASAIDLAPAGAIQDAVGRLGGIDLALRPYAPMAQWERFEFWSLREEGSIDLLAEAGSLQLLFDLDLDYDGEGDACMVHEATPPGSIGWVLHDVTLDDSFTVHDASCDSTQVAPDPIDGPRPLSELQDNPAWGRGRITGTIIGIGSDEAMSNPWPSGRSFIVDDLLFVVRSSTAADFDACFYPAAPATAPISCVSDIGPHDGPIPAGTRRVNVWADSLLPSGFAFEHPYIEPGTFFFHYLERGEAPAAGLLAARSVGSVTIVEDVNGNQEMDSGDPVLARVEGIEPTIDPQHVPLALEINPGPDGARRPDGPIPLIVRYDDGLPLNRPGLLTTTATENLILQWFVNDGPAGVLAASQRHPLGRKVAFTVAADDADDAQGSLAKRLGGLDSWQLDFGDGTAPIQGTTSSALATHKYAAGSYTASLTIVDRVGARSVSAVEVGILHPGAVAGNEIPSDD